MRGPAEEHPAERDHGHRATRTAEDRTAGEPAVADGHVSPTQPLNLATAQRLQATAGNRATAALVQRRAAAKRPPAPPARTAPPAGTASAQRSAAGPVPATAEAPPSEVETVGPAATGLDTDHDTATAAGSRGEAEGRVPVQRVAATADAPPRTGASGDPKFAALTADVRGKQKAMAAHPPPRAEAARAQGAAQAPPGDKEAQGKTANADRMDAAQPGQFDKAGFIRAVNEAIAAQAPKDLDEADKFAGSGKAEAVKGQVQGQVSAGKQASAGAITTATSAAPDTSAAVEKKVTPLAPDRPPGVPGTPDPAKAVPDKAPTEATDFSAGPRQVDQQMADAQVTDAQLANSGEPAFTGALADKKESEAHAATAPGQLRAAEAQTLSGARTAAAGAGAAAMAALASDRRLAGQQVTAGKEGTKAADEKRRADATATLQKVFDDTKLAVEAILTGLDQKVEQTFTDGEKKARDAFTSEHRRRMDEYKDKRYSGVTGAWNWTRDLFAGLPAEANQIFVTARKGYVDQMQQVISQVADLISTELTTAKKRIADGRAQLQAEVRKLPADLQALGNQTAGELGGKFDELTESVDAKGQELVQTLATKYNEALSSVDEEIAAEKEKNQGLVDKAVGAVKGVIDTILQLKDMLLGVLAKAAQAVMAIIKDPIGFLGNFFSAIGAGLRQFMGNIAEHLKKGLLGWLLGALASAGITLPAKFDLRGILSMIGSMLGLTWGAIRSRVIQRGVPAAAIGAVEQGVPIVQKLRSPEGIGGIWEDLKEKVGDLKTNLFSKISGYLIPTVLMAGITWIISLLNPASAFVKAVKMIIDFVSFVVNQGAQILEFVNAVLDAVISIAGGGTGGVPGLIENALARSVPVLIGALAAILGIGGVAEKVKKFFQSLSKPVMKAVDWVVGKIVGFGKKIWAKLKSKFGRKPKQDGPDQRTEQQKLRDVKAAVAAIDKVAGSAPDRKTIERHFGRIKEKYRLTDLFFEDAPDGSYHVMAVINPRWPTKEYPAGETKYTITENGKRRLRPKYSKGQPIRRYLYSSNNREGTQRIIRDRVTPLLRERDPATGAWRPATDYDSAQFWEPRPGQVVSLTDNRTKPTLEHNPPVREHWNNTGRKTSQDDRITFYNFRGKEDTAEVIMFYENREKATPEGYLPEVEEGFTEPGQ